MTRSCKTGFGLYNVHCLGSSWTRGVTREQESLLIKSIRGNHFNDWRSARHRADAKAEAKDLARKVKLDETPDGGKLPSPFDDDDDEELAPLDGRVDIPENPPADLHWQSDKAADHQG